jgi:hypothetical protein
LTKFSEVLDLIHHPYQGSHPMSLKAGLTASVLVLSPDFCSGPVTAQPTNCPDLYSRVMALYQTAPRSAEYNQMSAAYNTSCRANPEAANTGARGAASALPPQTSLPMRGAPTNTVPTESRAIVRGGSGGHK